MRVPLLVTALAALPLGAAAQDMIAARSLAATCANCHGTSGRSVATEATALAGMEKSLIVQRMSEFREGKRPATVMHQIAKGYTAQQIDLIAGYLSAQPK